MNDSPHLPRMDAGSLQFTPPVQSEPKPRETT
jgi:hypothetical protein